MSVHVGQERNQVGKGTIPAFPLSNSVVLGKLVVWFTQRRLSLWSMYMMYTRCIRSTSYRLLLLTYVEKKTQPPSSSWDNRQAFISPGSLPP